MTSPSSNKGKGREIEETTFEIHDETVDDTEENRLDSILEQMREWEKIKIKYDQLRSYTSDKKAGGMQTSTSPIESSSANNNTNDSLLHSTTQEHSVYSDDGPDLDDIYSDDGEDVETLQPSRFRTGLEQYSDEVPSANRSEQGSIDMLHGTSDYTESEYKSPTPPEPEKSYSQFRQCSADLMTRHIFSGRMNGKRPVYVPMYERDKYGNLFKLKRDEKGKWEYMQLEKLSESESQARLKLFIGPKTKKGNPKLEDSKRLKM